MQGSNGEIDIENRLTDMGEKGRDGEMYGESIMDFESESEVAQSCPTLSDPMDCSPPGSSAHGIFQARVLEWVAIAFSAMEYYSVIKGTHLSQF